MIHVHGNPSFFFKTMFHCAYDMPYIFSSVANVNVDTLNMHWLILFIKYIDIVRSHCLHCFGECNCMPDVRQWVYFVHDNQFSIEIGLFLNIDFQNVTKYKYKINIFFLMTITFVLDILIDFFLSLLHRL